MIFISAYYVNNKVLGHPTEIYDFVLGEVLILCLCVSIFDTGLCVYLLLYWP